VLLVEDEPTLGRVLELVLTTAGYAVTRCADGADALETFRASPNAVDVVVSDVTMPRLSGDRLARALLEIRPGLPVILMSGCITRLETQSLRTLDLAAVLEKPVGIDELVTAVDSVFERARRQA
jgi:two-component system, cell cycle sensor histidine kinase and response regulator CckA